MSFISPEVELRARVDILEADRDALYEAVGAQKERADDTLIKVKSDRALIMAVRTSQSEHFKILSRLLDGQVQFVRTTERMEHQIDSLMERTGLLNERQIRLEADVSGLKTDVSGLKEDVSGLKQGQARLEDKFDRLEALVRKGFGMDSEN